MGMTLLRLATAKAGTGDVTTTRGVKIVVAIGPDATALLGVSLRTARPLLVVMTPLLVGEVVEVRGMVLVAALTVTTVTLLPTSLLHEAPTEKPLRSRCSLP